MKPKQLHALFDEIQIAIDNDDRERLDVLLTQLAVATANLLRAS